VTIPNAWVNIVLSGDANDTLLIQADINGNYTHTFSGLSIGNYHLKSHILAADKTTSLQESDTAYFSIQKPLITIVSPTDGDILIDANVTIS